MSEARSMGCRPDYTVCIIRNGRLTKMQKKLDAKIVVMRDKKTRQLLIYIYNIARDFVFAVLYRLYNHCYGGEFEGITSVVSRK